MSDFRNDANDLRAMIAELYQEQRKIDTKISHTKSLFRLIELSENYTRSILQKDYTKEQLIDFCHNILVEETKGVLVSYPKFARALYHALNHHQIHTEWSRYFKIFEPTLLTKEETEIVLKKISKESNVIKTKADHEMVEKLIDYIIGHKIDEADKVVESLVYEDLEKTSVSLMAEKYVKDNVQWSSIQDEYDYYA